MSMLRARQEKEVISISHNAVLLRFSEAVSKNKLSIAYQNLMKLR